jgi:hypothetical protein
VLAVLTSKILGKCENNMDLDETLNIPKYELIMVLKENETLRDKNTKYKLVMAEMRDKSCNISLHKP